MTAKRNVDGGLALLLAGLLFLAGCTSPREVHVDALAAPAAEKQRSFTLVSDMTEVKVSDLFFKEVSRRVRLVLEEAGYRAAREGAALEIGVEAFLSEPMVQTETRSEPIYLDRPGYSRVVATPVMNADGKVVRFAYTTLYTPPRTQLSGYVNRDRQVTVHDKVLRLKARDKQNGEEVWTISSRLRSPSTDFRATLPYLLLAAKPYIGTATEGEVIIEIKPDAEELEALRQRFADAG